MYLEDYLWFLGAIVLCTVFSFFASAKVNRAFAKNNAITNRSRMTGYDATVRLLRSNGVYDVSIGRIRGSLTDHYNPAKSVINLSESTYGNDSIAAVAVAAHEAGHVMQNQNGYLPYKLRAALVPFVNFGSRAAMPLVLIGVLIDFLSMQASSNVGFYVALIGVVLYGLSLIFALVTLPVELDASRRAKKMLVSEGVLTTAELDGASEVLSAAALTYLASLLTSLVYFLRFLVYVLTIFGKRNDRR